MKQNRISLRKYSGRMTLVLMTTVSLCTVVYGDPPWSLGSGGILNPGDIVYVDSGNAIEGGFLIKVNPGTGERTVISSGAYLSQPFDLKIDNNAQVIVSDNSGCLLRVDPETGLQALIAENSSGTLGMPAGIVVDRTGALFVANTQAILRVDTATSQTEIVSSAGSFMYPTGIAVGNSVGLFVLNRAFPSEIVWVNPRTGAQRVISAGGYLNSPQAIALDGHDLYVTDVATADGNFGVGRIIHVNSVLGTQKIVAEGEHLVGPVGIVVDDDGQLIVADPYTINLDSPELYDGAIIRIDPATGTQTLVVRGQGGGTNPVGVTIVPGGKPGQKVQ